MDEHNELDTEREYDGEEYDRPRRRSGVTVFSFFNGVFFFIIFLLMAGAAFASVIGVIMLQDITRELPPIETMREFQPSLTSVIYDRKGHVIARLFEENRTWVDIGDMSPWVKRALIAAEDTEFYEHRGIRFKAIARALISDLRSGAARQGGSTITQQVARMLFLSRERTLQRKAAEAIIAIRMERLYPKDHILEMYLNMAYFGHGAYGIGAAAQSYFGKPASQLTLPEASMLAGLLPAPNLYTPLRHIDRAKTRQDYVLSRMEDAGMITADERAEAYGANLTYARSADSKVAFVMEDAPHFVSYILFQQLLPKYGRDKIYRGGLHITTTVDLELQKLAESVMAKQKFEGAILTLDPNTGEILAMAGGRNFDTSKFNRATQAFRQPGSSFKPIVYAAAFENGYRPVDRILDAPLHFPNGWSPKNSDATFRGEMTLADALCRSINTPAVRLTQVVGVETVRQQARNMGITTPYLPENLSVALGSSSVTPMEMCAAFSVFANNGNKIVPFGVKQILDSSGSVVEQTGPALSSAVSPETAAMMRSLLMQAVSWGTGTRAKIDGYQVYGKTGTTNKYTDVWFVGGTPDLVTVVYVGNDNHKTLGRAFGGTVAAPIWQEYMQQAVKLRGTPQKFVVPSGVSVQAVTICRGSGFIASGSCPQKANILIPVGQAPHAKCPRHGGDYSASAKDTNAPMLILSPNDNPATRSQYSQAPPSEPAAPVAAPPETAAAAAPPPAPEAEMQPYREDPEPADYIDRRYNELLEQYGLQ